MATDKRTDGMEWQDVQRGNQAWWTENPMAYDWHNEIAHPRFSRAWFDAVDARFLEASRLDLTRDRPFDRILPYERLRGARVLEIGCGMGLHTSLMAGAGAEVEAIDLSPTSIEATRKRLELLGLSARVQQADAERLPFADRTFDLVWSWGVIHHSARTTRIVREIGRVTKPEGEARVMVYNREGMSARIAFVRDHLLKGRFLESSFDETLFRGTDGFSARHYVREQLEDLFRGFFRDVSSEVLGQLPDAVPLPRRLRALVAPLVPQPVIRDMLARYGSFLFVVAGHPE
jgi:2-polyprenyl-3-methyl-5-hydroxy-6-metoxy-1,4-benzoquinol methylase